MFKKIDKLVIKSFIGPLIITTSVVVFIFLIRFLLMYFNEFIGKGLGYSIFGSLFGYFTLITIPDTLPLAVLLSALISFGNLGEFSELTALKAAGIKISRVFLPSFVFSILIAIFAFWFNTTVSPWANLKGYSTLWDIKTTKLTLSIDEGVFYTDIPGYSIKVKKKGSDGQSLQGIVIYDQRNGSGNNEITTAESGKMYTINNGAYLVFELFNGYNYRNIRDANTNMSVQQFMKNGFKHNKLVMSLESFGIKRTDEQSFKYHPYMKNLGDLNTQIDSLRKDVSTTQKYYMMSSVNLYSYHYKSMVDTSKLHILPGKWIGERKTKLFEKDRVQDIMNAVMADVNSVQSHIETNISTIGVKYRDQYMNEVEQQHKFTKSLSVLILFLIGSSLGSIIKKGGFGLPVLIAVSIFILMYVLTQFFDKLAKEGKIIVHVATWIPNLLLLSLGLWFLNLALNDKSFPKFNISIKIPQFLKKSAVKL